MLYKKAVLKDFAKFTGKKQCQSLFLIKLQPATLLKENPWHRCFPAEQHFRATFTEHLQTTASKCFPVFLSIKTKELK